jgi:hypothetical protein
MNALTRPTVCASMSDALHRWLAATFVLAPLLFSTHAAAAEAGDNPPSSRPSPEATSPAPEPTPFPVQDPGGVPHGYDDEIRIPPGTVDSSGRISADPGAIPPAGFDDQGRPLSNPADGDLQPPKETTEKWDPKKVFPGNYYALPLTMDFSFRPCLDCKNVPSNTPFLQRPGELSLWAGYAFQPFAKTSSPYMAGGVEWIFTENRESGVHDHHSQWMPTWRWGWNFTSANFYADGALIFNTEPHTRTGYHVGIGGSSVALLALSICVGELVPSVSEIGYDFVPDETGRTRARFIWKIGWGF